MSFTVPYHLDPLDYERKAFGPFTSRELKYGGIGIVLAIIGFRVGRIKPASGNADAANAAAAEAEAA